MGQIVDYLRGKTFFITGATGFVAKGFVEKLLTVSSDVKRIYLLIRPLKNFDGSVVTADERLRQELLYSPAFKRLRNRYGAEYESFFSDKIHAVPGDMTLDRLGMDIETYMKLSGEVDIVINSAATVVFDERLDHALQLNTLGPKRLIEFARSCKDPVFVHVSTAYVNGQLTGTIKEELHEPDTTILRISPDSDQPEFSLETEIDSIISFAAEVREEAYSPVTEKDFRRAAVRQINGKKLNESQLSEQIELARQRWIKRRLIDEGMRRGKMYGWHDSYTFTKAMGEQMVERTRGDLPTAIIRPPIVESSLRDPEPGWVDGLKAADTLIAHFGKGRLSDFPADPDIVLDIIPVDFVNNTIFAVLPFIKENADIKVYQIVTGVENPIKLGELFNYIYDYFVANPLNDKQGNPIRVHRWRFRSKRGFIRILKIKFFIPVIILKRVLDFIPRSSWAAKIRRKISVIEATLNRAFSLIEIYSPYTNLNCRFETNNVKELYRRLDEDEKRDFNFDVKGFDWKDYIQNIHLPGLKKYVLGLGSDVQIPEPVMSDSDESSGVPAEKQVSPEFPFSSPGPDIAPRKPNGKGGKDEKHPLYLDLLRDERTMLTYFDMFAQEIIEVGKSEGYFDGWQDEDIVWPGSIAAEGLDEIENLRRKSRIVTRIYEGVPPRRRIRLAEAYEKYRPSISEYHEANRIYIQVKKQFIESGAGTEHDLFQLYQSIYLNALASSNLLVPDPGEAAMERARINRIPLSHAQAVAEGLSASVLPEDARWGAQYEYGEGPQAKSAPLASVLQDIARKVVNGVAAGELVVTRYNIYNNLAWFGSSVWKILVDAEYVLACLKKDSGFPGREEARLLRLRQDVRLGQAMLVEFFQAHRENPEQIKPQNYWYGQNYSYLTRDMIDLTLRIIGQANSIINHSGIRGNEISAEIRNLEIPALFRKPGNLSFLEYPHVGKQGSLSSISRSIKIARWMIPSILLGRKKLRLLHTSLPVDEKREAAWKLNLAWAEKTLKFFGIDLVVRIDPGFKVIAEKLELEKGGRKILFMPTHQSLLDHPVMYHFLQSPELLRALGWKKPRPCVILARTGMAKSGARVKVGRLNFTMFGVSADDYDRLLEDIDGYVLLKPSKDTGSAIKTFINALQERPGIIYPTGTTSAFALQSIPFQHAFFSKLPRDVVIIPISLRGIHSLWPKCPKGNLDINPGTVEIIVSPPMLGETTLLPNRKSLRTQAEVAAFFQSIHLTTLLNPETAG